MKKEFVPVSLALTFQKQLRTAGVSDVVINALSFTVAHITPAMRRAAYSYGHSLEDVFRNYGVAGLKRNVGFMLDYMQSWVGPDAKESKQCLRTWIEG